MTELKGNEVQTVYSDGRQTVTGTLKVRLTNVDSGKSIDINISGPVTYTTNGDGSFTGVFNGRSLIFPNGANLISSGHVIMRVNADMTSFELMSVVGSTVDVCQALA